MNDESETKRDVVLVKDLERVQSADFMFVHSNSARLAENFYDIQIIFGAVIPRPKEELPAIEERVAVSMSWEHAKALYLAVKRSVDAYEGAHGPLRSPSQAGSKPILGEISSR